MQLIFHWKPDRNTIQKEDWSRAKGHADTYDQQYENLDRFTQVSHFKYFRRSKRALETEPFSPIVCFAHFRFTSFLFFAITSLDIYLIPLVTGEFSFAWRCKTFGFLGKAMLFLFACSTAGSNCEQVSDGVCNGRGKERPVCYIAPSTYCFRDL